MIQASDAVLAEDGDSEDPVAIRRVDESLIRKALALGRLDRHQEAVSTWDELLARAEDEPASRASRVVTIAKYWKARSLERLGQHGECVRLIAELIGQQRRESEDGEPRVLITQALVLKARALAALERIDDAIGACEEIIAREGSATEPDLRALVAWALQYESRTLLEAGRIEAALSVSVRLQDRLADEPPESLLRVAEIVNNHSMLLLRLGAPDPAAAARFVLLVLVNAMGRALGQIVACLPVAVRPPARRRPRTLSGRHRLVAARFARLRAQQAYAASLAVIAKIGSTEDPELRRQAAAAEFISGVSLFASGDARAGFNVVETYVRTGDHDAIQAFQGLAKNVAQDGGVVSELGRISTSALRARMLGGGDPDITKIAYEDSLAARAVGSRHPTISRLLTLGFRPQSANRTWRDRVRRAVQRRPQASWLTGDLEVGDFERRSGPQNPANQPGDKTPLR